MRLLERMGYRRLGHYGGGISHWRKAQLPLESGEQRDFAPELREELAMHPPSP
ncbi:MAG: hypothetical protein HYZ28_08125 [Myxococcales bacterium]|nr:hypothetical protein [Myxococcales bacterium]